ncbi:hypothetical protein [Acidiplasma sp.]|uniref:hypothetical protein n=1 Tax=Acidiplasma sp. TaxID=1872114 RepID=UPI0025906ACF|nr:hypothetical protein [Acidiplasma sp.]
MKKSIIIYLFSLLIYDILVLFYRIDIRFKFVIIFAILISITGIYLSSDIFTDVAAKIGKKLEFSGKTVGILILGIASIFDEIVMSLMAALEGHGEISFGSIQGSNTVVMLAFFIIIPFYYMKTLKTYRLDAVFILASSIIILAFSFIYEDIPAYIGIIPMIIFIIYFYIINRKNVKTNTAPEFEDYPYIYGLISLLVIVLGSYAMISSAIVISDIFNITSFFASFILLGVFGSIPEITMVGISLHRHRVGESTGLITGSTVYKNTLVFALAAFTSELTLKNSYFSIILMLIISIIFLIITVFAR